MDGRRSCFQTTFFLFPSNHYIVHLSLGFFILNHHYMLFFFPSDLIVKIFTARSTNVILGQIVFIVSSSVAKSREEIYRF